MNVSSRGSTQTVSAKVIQDFPTPAADGWNKSPTRHFPIIQSASIQANPEKDVKKPKNENSFFTQAERLPPFGEQ